MRCIRCHVIKYIRLRYNAMVLLLRAWQTSCETKYNIYTLTEFGAQGRV